jgi:hypothetical protein
MKTCLFFLLWSFSLIANAKMYQCTDSNGNVIFSESPCVTESKETGNSNQNDSNRVWYTEKKRDEKSGHTRCTLYSPMLYAVLQKTKVYYIRVVSGMVTFYTPEGTFAQSLAGSGLQVDTHEFIVPSNRIDNGLILFGKNESDKLLSWMQEGKVLKGKVMFVPKVDQKFQLELNGFKQALDQLRVCEAENKE